MLHPEFRSIPVFLSIAAMCLLAVSCSHDGAQTEALLGPTGEDPAEKVAAGSTGYCDVGFHDRMEEYIANDDDVLFLIFRETIEWEDGGVLDATPSGWPEGYEIKLVFPPQAVDPGYEGYESVAFSVAVPVAGPGPGVTSVPIDFYPGGIPFAHPPTLVFAWPPWAGVPENDTLTLVTIQTELHDGDVHYRMPDALATSPNAMKAVGGIEPPGGWTDLQRSTGLEFPVPHFSRWRVVDGDESDDGDPPGFDDDGDRSEGQTCWTPFPDPDPDPLAPAELLR